MSASADGAADATLDAEAWKTRGNASMSAGNPSRAIAEYSHGLELAGDGHALSHVLYSNRSAAFLSRNAPGDAIAALADASASIRASRGTWARAHARKAAALLLLGQYEDAVAACTTGLRADAGNEQLRQYLKEAQEKLVAERAKQAEEIDKAQARAQTEEPGADAVADPLAAFMEEIAGLERGGGAAAAAAAGTKRPRDGGFEPEEIDVAESAHTDARAHGSESDEEDDGGAAAAAAACENKSGLFSQLSPAERAQLEEQSKRLAATDLGPGSAHVGRLTGPRAKWLNLNPFEVLSLPHTVSDEDIRMRYRKLSALVHPDKHPGNPAASDAFQEVKKAHDTLLDPARRKVLINIVVQAIKAGRRERREHIKLGRAEHTLPPVDVYCTNAIRRAFADQHQRRLHYEHRIKAEAKREAEAEVAEQEEILATKKAETEWAAGTNHRMESWVSFASKKPKLGDGGLKLNDTTRYGAAAASKVAADEKYKMKWR